MTFVDLGGITLEDHVLIGPDVRLVTVNHLTAPEQRRGLRVDHSEKMHGLGQMQQSYRESRSELIQLSRLIRLLRRMCQITQLLQEVRLERFEKSSNRYLIICKRLNLAKAIGEIVITRRNTAFFALSTNRKFPLSKLFIKRFSSDD